ncbi:sporulation phosphorelay system protein KapB [Paenibacillus contaminans]|uniref:Kinase n=1 Tax=Paenibacillus contaminans TaxID=450362 RepID=A0A329ML16_9BACL|nr:sporulation phosphorelay system protein KapB [Paenibacillus contaminans]RAV20611.1 kinase [Paenibacillus contaminans]
MNQPFAIGNIVRAAYKTGEYIGEIVELGAEKAAVRVLAVLRHPTQGDLHRPNNPDVGFFHQRRALAFQEIALMPYQTIGLYSQQIPDYKESLRKALQADIDALQKTVRFAERSLEELEALKRDYNV